MRYPVVAHFFAPVFWPKRAWSAQPIVLHPQIIKATLSNNSLQLCTDEKNLSMTAALHWQPHSTMPCLMLSLLRYKLAKQTHYWAQGVKVLLN